MYAPVIVLFLVFTCAFGKLMPAKPKIEVGNDFVCETCITFMDNAIDQLLNIIANGGIIGSCGALCSYLPAQWEQAACNLVCDAIGIEGFIQLIEDVDPDPVWICMEGELCPIADGVTGRTLSISVSPRQGPAGTTFTVSFSFQTYNTTGTGTVEVVALPPDGSDPVGGIGFFIQQPAGNYTERAQIDTTPSDDEPFAPGTYKVIAAVCEGSCGSIHSHSYTIAQGQTSFIITNS